MRRASVSLQSVLLRIGFAEPCGSPHGGVLYEGRDPKLVVIDLMGRAKRSELEESWS